MSFGAFNRHGITMDGLQGMAAYGVSGDWDGKTPPLFRLSLYRGWDEKLPAVTIIDTNPTDEATHERDDEWLLEWIKMAQERGFGRLWVGGIYPLRSTCKDSLAAYYMRERTLRDYTVDAINMHSLECMAFRSSLIVAAWDEQRFSEQGDKVVAMLDRRLKNHQFTEIEEW
jgi:hypothetical protein